MRRLPPLNHLRAFEAAARLGSFKTAATELCVTDSAVSQHVRLLEEFFDAPLFLRTHAGVSLTPAGKEYLPKLTHALDVIADASAQFRVTSFSGLLRVSVVPSLGSRWLIPRLDHFTQMYPDIRVEPLMTPEVVDMGDGTVDIAIRHGDGNWPDADVTFLRNETLVPVASPSLVKRKKFSGVSALLQFPLLSAKARQAEWPSWFTEQGVDMPKDCLCATYDSIALAIDAAITGGGIALVDQALVSDDIKFKRLRVLMARPGKGVGAYFILTPKARSIDPRAAAFRDWLTSEVSRETP